MLIHVKVEPDSHTDEVIQKRPTSYIVKVRAPADRNQANIRMLSVLAAYLKVDKNKLRIITGHHVTGKIVEIIKPLV
jgi:uncharacterized protein YggU (UPF0235/DUF167 family)